MQTNQAEWLTAWGHAFDWSTGVCAKCKMKRAHWDGNGKPRCGSGKREALVHFFIDLEDEADSNGD
jgi:hypothetical protein